MRVVGWSAVVAVTASTAIGAGALGAAARTPPRTLHRGPAAAPQLVLTSPDDGALHLPSSRVVFSAVTGGPAAPDQAVTFANTGTATLSVTGLAITGADAAQFALPSGTTTLSIAPGSRATVPVRFAPTAPTGCPTSANPSAVGAATRTASLTFATNQSGGATTEALAGVVACGYEGAKEPTLDQLVGTLGFSTVVSPTTPRRSLGPLRHVAGTDEVDVPFFVPATGGGTVSVVPVARYTARDTEPSQSTGWYAAGDAVADPCGSACHQLWQMPADTTTAYVQNQELFPQPTGSTSFTPGGPFGLYSGAATDPLGVAFSDDSRDVARRADGSTITPVHDLHMMRVFPAYGPGHVQLPDTYLVAVDSGLVPANKNEDFQDVVLLVTGAVPATSAAAAPGSASLQHDLTSGGTVGPTCAVTGFDGVLPDSGGTACAPADIAFGAAGLTLTGTPGTFAAGDQQNALFDRFDASLGRFTATARVVDPQATADGQRIGAWVGPDTGDLVAVELQHGSGGPQVAMLSEQGGTVTTLATVAAPSISGSSTVDLIVTGDTQMPDPTPAGSDPDRVRGFPLAELTVSYAVDGGTPVQVGTVVSPADLASWFSPATGAGLEVSSPTDAALRATYSSFALGG